MAGESTIHLLRTDANDFELGAYTGETELGLFATLIPLRRRRPCKTEGGCDKEEVHHHQHYLHFHLLHHHYHWLASLPLPPLFIEAPVTPSSTSLTDVNPAQPGLALPAVVPLNPDVIGQVDANRVRQEVGQNESREESVFMPGEYVGEEDAAGEEVIGEWMRKAREHGEEDENGIGD
ncbi:hypothetical protein BDN72DRAFT_903055 [Pluteus cervinus]|uniref:Uncharacterized protein n=1 Tax=Pluteus cervinus TaxID=181527 RepID=A0ACD3ABE3_9AGAR|nr:hypothetical protein BDN72DRAFT_903055 [Pluteus cervinus]